MGKPEPGTSAFGEHTWLWNLAGVDPTSALTCKPAAHQALPYSHCNNEGVLLAHGVEAFRCLQWSPYTKALGDVSIDLTVRNFPKQEQSLQSLLRRFAYPARSLILHPKDIRVGR
ncbi:hypothetical protein PoB_005781700 [Plakobranchus ocellatus]|uniref:Uncharacterized protein n=1 Tax=Plakobranchus ocellatus TaxID=259542 RepID=A0AAV4CIL8_9GAST|nr:hypothetical protein PoB_005781700 [Plakobranchus ocellatus]